MLSHYKRCVERKRSILNNTCYFIHDSVGIRVRLNVFFFEYVVRARLSGPSVRRAKRAAIGYGQIGRESGRFGI